MTIFGPSHANVLLFCTVPHVFLAPAAVAPKLLPAMAGFCTQVVDQLEPKAAGLGTECL